MRNHHVTHLLTRYVHGQLRPAQRAQVINHVRSCPDCRAALAREERIVADLRREMPVMGHATAGQLSQVWAGVWQEIGTPRPPSRLDDARWLPGLSVVLAMLLVLAVALPLLVQGGLRAEAAPLPPRPYNAFATASPTPGITDDAPLLAGQDAPTAQAARATVAFAAEAGASPAPMPAATVSPEAYGGGIYHR